MNRKMLSLAMALLVFISTSVIVSAEEISDFEVKKEALLSTINMSEEINNALKGVTDTSVTEDIMSQVGVQVVPTDLSRSYLMDINDNDRFDIKYTVKNVGDIVLENGNMGTMYSLTAVAKEKEEYNEVTEDNVNSYISLVWIDKLGMNNELVSVSGGWIPNGRSLSNRQVYYGVAYQDGSFVEGKNSVKYPSSNSFYYKAPSGYVGFSLRAYSWVDSAGYPYSILCYVKSSITSRADN